MKNILLGFLGLVLAVLAGHQVYLSGLASYAPELAAEKGLVLTQGFTDIDGDGVNDVSDNCV